MRDYKYGDPVLSVEEIYTTSGTILPIGLKGVVIGAFLNLLRVMFLFEGKQIVIIVHKGKVI